MADIIRGTNIADPIVPYTAADNIPTHYAKYGKGGFRTVENKEERDNIPLERREPGMLVYVITDDSNIHTYQWFPIDGDPDKEWKRSKMGGGDSIPIYDSAKLEELGDAAEKDYISIPDIDINGEVVGNTYTTTKNGSYVDVLFSAIRALQSEVARLRNAFNYGIYSYSGTDTAMSRVQGVYKGDVEEEPLWAIDEDGLSLQTNLIQNISDFDEEYNINHTTDGFPYFIEATTWRDSVKEVVQNVDDSKLFLYLTTNSLDISIKLKDRDSEVTELTLKLDTILNNIKLDWYNVLLVISRKQEIKKAGEEESTYLGSNFIWISVGNAKTNNTIAEGYLDDNDRNLVGTLVTRNIRYTIELITFNAGVQLSKAIIYSKYQDFSQEVIPSTPTDSDFSYKAAHITIRSVSTYSILDSIKNQLPENELIFVEDTKKLYIKNNYRLVAISGAGDEQQPPGDDTMTAREILQVLADQGIINIDPVTGKYTELKPLSGITLINDDTGKQFEISVDAYGNLIVNDTSSNEDTLAGRLSRFEGSFPPPDSDTWTEFRGFVGQLRIKEEEISDVNKNIGLNSDRIKIGSFYAPARNQLTFGCSHGFIELENTSNRDFQLDGCYLHYSRRVGNNIYTSHLALSGKVPAGGTYLIRCKQYSDPNDPNTFIKINHYDIEWYDKDITSSPLPNTSGDDSTVTSGSLYKKLVDLSHNGIVGDDPHALALTYGKTYNVNTQTEQPIVFTYRSTAWISNSNSNTSKKAKALWWPKFIDGVYYNSVFKNSNNNAYWASTANAMASSKGSVFLDAIYRNTFELDPAQQAYQALNTYDSSRYRNDNVADYQYVLLNNEYISFPKTDEIYPVTKFTPKASFENRNILTDKNKLDPDKPNCVTCSFGINPYTTRTFNWVSSGYFDEYVWVRERKEQAISWKRFSSYTEKAEGTEAVQNSEGVYPWRKEFNAEINNAVYKRIYGYFPGDKNCTYTSHKCILDIVGQRVNTETVYEYVVGRSLANGEPDPEHTSDIMTFTLYPEDYPLRIYQTTDQQGFHWIEYQSWGAAANYINDRINTECGENNHIIPILMNTGDMTQSGSRVNEWVDYYNAGKRLFNHLEQVNCVGNNDLCGTIVTDLGTGDDIGKSNSFYFHVFYCYEVDVAEGSVPIVNGKYVPSLYHIDFKDFRIVMVNSEITYENCKSWYRMVIDRNGALLNDDAFSSSDFDTKIANGDYSVVNIYTGWTVGSSNLVYLNGFTSIYTILYQVLTNTGNRNCIVACHEMPFTVITHDNLKTSSFGSSRSADGASLVGSHLNQINTSDSASIYWFSRLLESTRVKLCLGGHKHTYSQTWPLRENYYYKFNGEWKSSLLDGPMIMEENLSNDKDNVKWVLNEGESVKDAAGTTWSATSSQTIHLSKFPIIEGSVTAGASAGFISPGVKPETPDPSRGVTYFMCQATGFKLMSNKELPAPRQIFSRYIPQSQYSEDTKKWSASVEQRYPMYAVIDLGIMANKILGKLIRLGNIQSAPKNLFNQLNFGTGPIIPECLYDDNTAYGGWRKEGIDNDNIIDINLS